MPDHSGKQSSERRTHGDLPLVPGPLDYVTDAWQRSVLFLDVMRQRSDQYREHVALEVPHVLSYDAELVCDGRTLERPVNYLLVRIVPRRGRHSDPAKRPFVVVDPRAGHGPGIGGFKADSEIGVAMKAGHPCYFVGFLPEPVRGQTIGDIARAEADFLKIVADRHPEAEGKPCVIGNCQAGWAIMIMAALQPELLGPIIVAGSPLSYWAGVRGQFPMRYSGGLLGGSWLTALVSDLGAGVFDGAWLVQNFENQNPANTLWTKHYNLWAKIDTEAPRYLEFERWWGGHVNLNAEEIQFIVDELFVGNKLAAGEVRTPDGTAIDLRNIRSPIIVFCSRGDNITPPQQALGWILDCYDSVDEIRAYGQTIVYTIHDKVGHLGIFVSGGVARKEHDEFTSNIDLIDTLPPGLYEAVLTPKDDAAENPELVTGEWVMRCEERTLDDIRALGGNDLEDERRFAAAARLSEINLSLYRALAAPLVRAMVRPPMAEALRRVHPLRLQYELMSSVNPFMSLFDGLACQVRANRRPVPADHPLVSVQEQVSKQVILALDGWRQMVERASEQAFHALYGSPALQAALGIDRHSDRPPRKARKDLIHERLRDQRIAGLREQMRQGGLREAFARALLYVGMARGMVDERGFEAIRNLRKAKLEDSLPLPEFKAMIRDQFLMLLIDEAAAIEAIHHLLPADREHRTEAFGELERILRTSGDLTTAGTARLERIAEIFGVEARNGPPSKPPSRLGRASPPRSEMPSDAAALKKRQPRRRGPTPGNGPAPNRGPS